MLRIDRMRLPGESRASRFTMLAGGRPSGEPSAPPMTVTVTPTDERDEDASAREKERAQKQLAGAASPTHPPAYGEYVGTLATMEYLQTNIRTCTCAQTEEEAEMHTRMHVHRSECMVHTC
jgi:hypothetical protein